MSESNISGPLHIDDALVVGGALEVVGGITFSGGTINAENALDVTGGTITAAVLTATGVVSAGNFSTLGTVGVHNALTVHSLVNEGAYSGFGTVGMHAAVEVHSLVDEGAFTALGTSGVAALASSGLVQAANLSSAGTLGVIGNTTLAGASLTFGTQVFTQASSIPSGGVIGNICFMTAPVAGGPIGWACIAPGSWKAFGTLAA